MKTFGHDIEWTDTDGAKIKVMVSGCASESEARSKVIALARTFGWRAVPWWIVHVPWWVLHGVRFLLIGIVIVGIYFIAQTLLAQPIPPLTSPPPPSVVTRTTNEQGDVITVVVRKGAGIPKLHYYGVINASLHYIGEMSAPEYQVWAYSASLHGPNGPNIAQWITVFSVTNRFLEMPALVHYKLCP